MNRSSLIAATALSLLLLPQACASKLKRDLTDNAPTGQGLDGVEAALDLSLVTLHDVKTGEAINLKAYMDASGKDFLLLTFGSKGCAACNRKAIHLRDDIIGRHPLYLTDAGKRFEVIGVNTDPERYERLAGYLHDFEFIRWSDPSGQVMMQYFMPPPNLFSVPLTVMVKRDGIAWRVLPHETLSVEEIMAKVEVTLGLRDSVPPPNPGNHDDGGDEGDGGSDGETPPPPPPDIPMGPLGMPVAGRLKSVDVTSCDGTKETLDAALGLADLRFVQVAAGSCGVACEGNAKALKALKAACPSGKTCAVATLVGGALTTNDCATGIAVQGGAAFFETFKTHFNWNYPRELGPDWRPYLTHAVEGPLVFGFAADGTLVYSKEGALAESELADAVKAAGFGQVARGPDFPLWTAQDGAFGFADWRRKAKYTVINAWQSVCTSCIKELKHWSQPGQLVDFCAAHPQDCQVGALEIHYAPDGKFAEYYESLLAETPEFEGFRKAGIRVPLVLDPVPDGPGEKDYLNRLWDGYMMAATPELKDDPRSFIYDREGKLVAAYKSDEPAPGQDDPVLKKLKELLAQ